jgi:hypothetical protein
LHVAATGAGAVFVDDHFAARLGGREANCEQDEKYGSSELTSIHQFWIRGVG